MKLRTLPITLLTVLFSLGAAHAEEHITAINKNNRTITVGRQASTRTYTVDQVAAITLNGQKADFSELGVGMGVELSLADEKTVREVRANGVAASPQPKRHRRR